MHASSPLFFSHPATLSPKVRGDLVHISADDGFAEKIFKEQHDKALPDEMRLRGPGGRGERGEREMAGIDIRRSGDAPYRDGVSSVGGADGNMVNYSCNMVSYSCNMVNYYYPASAALMVIVLVAAVIVTIATSAGR